MPLPFSRVALLVGDPFRVPPEASKGEMDERRKSLEEILNRLTAQAEREVTRDA